MQGNHNEIDAREAFGLLKGWFNNKMTVVVFRIQYAHIYLQKQKRIDAKEQLVFLNDIQHHFSRRGMGLKEYYAAIKWLKAFFRVYPSKKMALERSRKAWRMLKFIYQGFGFKYPFTDDCTHRAMDAMERRFKGEEFSSSYETKKEHQT